MTHAYKVHNEPLQDRPGPHLARRRRRGRGGRSNPRCICYTGLPDRV